MEKTGLSPGDPSSFSRPDLAIVTDIFLNLDVEFESKTLKGFAILTGNKVAEDVNELILDTYKLNITSISDENTQDELEFRLSEQLDAYGSKLTIQLPPLAMNTFKIHINYETAPDANGLQWLPPQTTAGKVHPFLFSQFEPTYARSFVPCQDTPSVKQTYKAAISAPKDLTVLMSAVSEGSSVLGSIKKYNFNQSVPVPSYLIAIAVGSLESRVLGPRSRVWAEKEIIEDCAYEFALTEHQLQTAEEICGPYVWGIYDLLVLPPSFPYGGMENPCLTFVTPTLLAGDRSLANVIAHEIAHSWTGNLVTNKSFEHFWLNEGFTVFIERKILGQLVSSQQQDFDAYTGISDLKEAISVFGENNPLTQLVVDLKGVHPEEAFSVIPYEKGHIFLRYLEEVVGGPAQFEPFLRKYFETFKYKSIDTTQFKEFFEKYFASVETIKDIDWDKWLYSPGMPKFIPNYDTSLADYCNKLFDKFNNWTGNDAIPITVEDKEKLMPEQMIYFLQKLVDGDKQSIKKLIALNEVFHLDNIKNSEIKFRWLKIGIKAEWEEKIKDTLDWVNSIGRMKFVRPLYRLLYKWEFSREKAVDNFKENRKHMMHVSAMTLAKDMQLES